MALLLGLGCGVLAAVPPCCSSAAWRLGLAVGLALLVSIFLAAIAGALLPLGLRRVGLDPAVASGPVLAAVHDVTGIFVYFSLAAALLRHVPH
ncbi:MAG: magnesium transporter [Thermoanaerobaculia bacterium]